MDLFGIPGLRTVARVGRNVFACVDLSHRDIELLLQIEDRSIYFEPCFANPYEDYPFDVSYIAEHCVAEPAGDGDERLFSCEVNKISNWAVAGGETIQLRIEQRDAPLKIVFQKPILAEREADPLWFRAHLAIHRGKADLAVTFKDTETGVEETNSLAFDESFRGGTSADLYQDVRIKLPAGIRKFETLISVDYRSYVDNDGSGDAPFLFIANARVAAADPRDASYFVGESRPGPRNQWLLAQAPEDFVEDQLFRIRSADVSHLVTPKELDIARNFFDIRYYVETNPDIDFSEIDPFEHYLKIGWREARNPNPELNVREYLLRHADVDRAGVDPLLHYSSQGKTEHRSLGVFEEILREIWERSGAQLPSLDEPTVLARAQDLMLPMDIIDTRRLIVMVVPEHNAMSGGIYSMFSIANQVRRTRQAHGYDVIIMTRPNRANVTYIRNSSFQNSETVFRFEQLRLFRNVSELQIHIPEYATVEFVRGLSSDMLRYLLRRDSVHINVLNQNIRLMPERDRFRDLRRITTSIGQSVAHHAYSGQHFADLYNLPTLLLPAHTDLTPYPAIEAEKKENIIIYSDDTATYRSAVMERLGSLKDYRLVKISGMTFDRYMDLATRCRFSVSFGEGFDGYVAQPIYQGGIGFALYNDEFFPCTSFRKYENFFESETEMIDQIVPTIQRLETDSARYRTLNSDLRTEWDKLYSYDDYVDRIGRLIRKEYEVFPSQGISGGWLQ